MKSSEIEVVQGTLDMFILKAVSFSPRHGYAILDWLRRTTHGELRLEDAALYPALHRLEARGFIESEWGLSENNRRAKYYTLTPAGRRRLREYDATWRRYVELATRILDATTAVPA
jgi:PadR family transcriptional regulator, regulatory protein PadR